MLTFHLSVISEAVLPVRLKFYETWKNWFAQSFQSDNVHQTGDGLVVTLN